MFGIDAATLFVLTAAAVALIIYGAAFGDPRPYRADWAPRRK